MPRSIVCTDKAPSAIGPYSQGVACEDLVFVSGQIPLDPATGEPVTGGIEEQTRRCLENLVAVLAAAGSDAEHVLKTTIFLTDMADFSRVNAVYATYFPSDPPARSCVAVAALPRGVAVEVEAIAVRKP